MKKLLLPLLMSMLLAGCTSPSVKPVDPDPIDPGNEPIVKEVMVTPDYFTLAGGSGYVNGDINIDGTIFYSNNIAKNTGKFKDHTVIQFKKETGYLFNRDAIARTITITYRLQDPYNNGSEVVDPNHELTIYYGLEENPTTNTVTGVKQNNSDTSIAVYEYQVPDTYYYYTIANLSDKAQYIDSIAFTTKQR